MVSVLTADNYGAYWGMRLGLLIIASPCAWQLGSEYAHCSVLQCSFIQRGVPVY